MTYLFIINDSPYGNERPYNALRQVMALQKKTGDLRVMVSLLGDAVANALKNQKTPNGYYNIEKMMRSILAKGGKVKL